MSLNNVKLFYKLEMVLDANDFGNELLRSFCLTVFGQCCTVNSYFRIKL